MRKFLFVFLFSSLGAFAQKNDNYNTITKIDEKLYFMFYDSSNTKSTIVEFDNFIALLELPIKDEGGGARNLKDHSEGAEKALRSLKHYFPNKPLKYLIHSHWHPHSISSVKPFISKGITLVSTQANFEKLKEFVDTTTIAQYGKNIQFVTTDSLLIADKGNQIIAYRFKQSEFPNTPTPDYLYFYLPNYNFVHCGCMYNKWNGDYVAGKEVLTGREEDLHRFLEKKKLKPSFLIRLNNEKVEKSGMQPYFNLDNVIKNGIKINDIAQKYLSLDEELLRNNRDSLLKELIINNIPASIFNSGVYAALGKKKLEKALIFAQYQVMLNPSDPNAWDSLGEVYYFLGEKTIAKQYEKQCRLIAPSFKNGGESVWAKDWEEHQKLWNK